MTNRVAIRTGSRLHFGLLAHRPQVGRHFGGAGVMIDSPGVELSAEKSERDEVHGPNPEVASRVRKAVAKYREGVSESRQPPPCKIELKTQIPPHQGLGSGTQLALAVGKAVSMLADESNLKSPELARRVGRGARSALGAYGFDQGGLLVDGGKQRLDEISTLVARLDFPEDWRFVLVSPEKRMGLSGKDERAAFQKLSGTPESLTNRLSRILLMEFLPAVVEEDFAAVADALSAFGDEVGGYFASVQGSRFAYRPFVQLAEDLRREGVRGIAQSSWGPTIFLLQNSEHAAEILVEELRNNPIGQHCRFHVAAPMNRGAGVSMT